MSQTPAELTENELAEIYRLLRIYIREADRAGKAKAYLAACVMEAAAIEALLISMVAVFLDEALATGKYLNRKKHPKPILDLTLAELIAIAKATGWLPAALQHEVDNWSARKAQIGDYAEVAREVRNLLHPGRHVRQWPRRRITPRMLNTIADITDGVRDWLLARVERSLIEAMKAEGVMVNPSGKRKR